MSKILLRNPGLMFAAGLISATSIAAKADVTYNFQPDYMDSNPPQNSSANWYAYGSFNGISLEFADDVFADETHLKDVVIYNISRGETIGTDRLGLYLNGKFAEITVALKEDDESDNDLCGGQGAPYIFSVSIPKGLFGNAEWAANNFNTGLANPELTAEYAFGEPVITPQQPQIIEGSYTLISADKSISKVFEPLYSDDHQSSYEYNLILERLDNIGFVIEYSQMMGTDMYPGEVSAGYLVSNDSETLQISDGGNFEYNCYTSHVGEQQPLFMIGDFDFLENVNLTLTFDGYGQTLRISGIGKYNSPERPITDDVIFSIVLPGGTISQNLKKDTDFEFTLVPDEEWEIHSCTLNHEDITSSIDSNGRINVNIAEPSELSVVYQLRDSAVRNFIPSFLKVYSRYGGIEIQGKPAETVVAVYDINGACVYIGKENNIPLQGGVYIVNIDNLTYKLSIQ